MIPASTYHQKLKVGEAISEAFKRLQRQGMPTEAFWTELGGIAIERIDMIRDATTETV
jgi:hypothetical protein